MRQGPADSLCPLSLRYPFRSAWKSSSQSWRRPQEESRVSELVLEASMSQPAPVDCLMQRSQKPYLRNRMDAIRCAPRWQIYCCPDQCRSTYAAAALCNHDAPGVRCEGTAVRCMYRMYCNLYTQMMSGLAQVPVLCIRYVRVCIDCAARMQKAQGENVRERVLCNKC